jgi:hypothetical protein
MSAISELTNRASYSIASLQTYWLGQSPDLLRQEDTKREVLQPCWQCNGQEGNRIGREDQKESGCQVWSPAPGMGN